MGIAASVVSQALMVAGCVLFFEPTAGLYQFHAAAALLGLGVLVAMVWVIDRLVADAVPAVVVGLKLIVCLVCCSGGVSVLLNVMKL